MSHPAPQRPVAECFCAPEFRPSGDTGLTIVLGSRINAANNARVLNWRAAIDAAGLPGVVETVPSYVSLLVHYDPLRTSQEALIGAIRELDGDAKTASAEPARRWVFPLCAEGPAFAPDLPEIAARTGLAEDTALAEIASLEQVVYMLGFAPGQPYLGDLPERLALPRRAQPIPQVPAGSVLIATGKTVIYPVANPTGWYVIGRSPVPLFDARSEQPVLLAPGDRLRFKLVDRTAYAEAAEAVAAGRLDPAEEWRV